MADKSVRHVHNKTCRVEFCTSCKPVTQWTCAAIRDLHILAAHREWSCGICHTSFSLHSRFRKHKCKLEKAKKQETKKVKREENGPPVVAATEAGSSISSTNPKTTSSSTQTIKETDPVREAVEPQQEPNNDMFRDLGPEPSFTIEDFMGPENVNLLAAIWDEIELSQTL